MMLYSRQSDKPDVGTATAEQDMIGRRGDTLDDIPSCAQGPCGCNMLLRANISILLRRIECNHGELLIEWSSYRQK